MEREHNCTDHNVWNANIFIYCGIIRFELLWQDLRLNEVALGVESLYIHHSLAHYMFTIYYNYDETHCIKWYIVMQGRTELRSL